MGKSGAFATGESKTGGFVATQTVALPTTVLGLETTTQRPLGPTGEFHSGGAPTGGTSVEQLPVEVTGAGTATASLPTTELGLTTPVFTPSYVINAPTTQLGLTTPLPEATGSGTATRTLPTTELGLQAAPGARIGFDSWILDGDEMGRMQDERATHDALALSFRVETATLSTVLRPLKSDEGQVDVLVTDSGGYTAVDRADGGNTFELIPPVWRKPLRHQGDYHVESYEEGLVSQAVDEWDVDLDFVPTENRSDSPSISETPTGDEWGLSTRYGTIATERIDAEFLGTGADGVERFEVVMRLTFDQAHAFEAALARLEGVRVRQIPDETNEAIDDTSGDSNTLSITSPTDDVIADGDYVVLAWDSTRLNEAYNEISCEVAREG